MSLLVTAGVESQAHEGAVELVYHHGTELLTLVLLIAAAFAALIALTFK